jgi:hypothetical protein
MTAIEAISIAACIAYVLLSQYVFRFQRTTRGVSHELVGVTDPRLQILVTPNWMGALGWLSTALWIIATILTWVAFGWLGGVGVVIYAFIFGALTDIVSPFPTYTHCFNVIESALRSGPRDLAVDDLLDKVRSIRSQHGR